MTRAAGCAASASSPAGPGRAGRLAVLALGLTLVALALLLGSWQLQRRQWKLALIERVQTRVHAAPVPAPGRPDWARLTAAEFEYRHVRLGGVWRQADSTWVAAATELGSGYWLMTPLQQADGSVVWVNRGFMSPAARARWQATDDGAATVTGLLRLSETGPRWLRHNDPAAERWYWRDLQALSARRGLAATAAPYFVDAAAAPAAEPAEPIAGMTVIRFPNNHLAYALTWFALAALAAWGTRVVWRAPAEAGSGSGSGSGDNTTLD